MPCPVPFQGCDTDGKGSGMSWELSITAALLTALAVQFLVNMELLKTIEYSNLKLGLWFQTPAQSFTLNSTQFSELLFPPWKTGFLEPQRIIVKIK